MVKRILIACEFSGIVRDTFISNGYDAVSCDILDTEREGPHIKGDVLEVIDNGSWDLMIAHPPCKYLCNSGVRWLIDDDIRYCNMLDAVRFFNALLSCEIPLKCVENSIPHKYAREKMIRGYDQIIYPYQFGFPERKGTCLWLEGLPKIDETNNIKGRLKDYPKNVTDRVHYASPGKDRWKDRSRTLSVIADQYVRVFGSALDDM